MKLQRAILLLFFMFVAASTTFAVEITDSSNESFSFNGHMLYRGRIYNLDFNDDSSKGSLNRQNYFGDLSLRFTLKPSEYVTGFFELHKYVFLGQEYRYNSIQTGEEVLPEDFDLMLSDSTTVKLPLRRNTDEAWEMHLRQAWMDIKLPGVLPMKLKFGRQPFILGNGIYTNSNLASVFGYQLYSDFGSGKPSVRLGSMKYYEGLREDYEEEEQADDPDDADLFFIDASAPLKFGKSTNIGGFLTTFRDNTFALDLMAHYNLGLTADVTLENGWSLSSEFNYQLGSLEDGAPNGDLDLSGYAFMLNVGAPSMLNEKVKLSGEFGIGSGDDPDTADEFEGYVGVGPFYPYAWAYEYRFIHWIHNSSKFFSKYGSRGMAENLSPGMENTMYLKATGTFSLPKKCQFIFSPIYLGMTQEGESFGYEIDSIFNAPVYNNFSYQFIFAYVIPSDYIKENTAGPAITDNSWAIRSQLRMTF